MREFQSKIGFILALLLFCGIVSAKDSDSEATYQSRLFGDLVVSPLKKLDLDFHPEVRLNEDWEVSKYFIELGAGYNVVSNLELLANYRFLINPREKKETEYLNQYSLGVKLSKDFGRFKPYYRFLYSNYADDADNGQYLRNKIKLKYNIKNCKLTPSVAVETFHEVAGPELYKWRFTSAIDYKIVKKNYITLFYKFDNYKDDQNRHILGLGYKFKL